MSGESKKKRKIMDEVEKPNPPSNPLGALSRCKKCGNLVKEGTEHDC